MKMHACDSTLIASYGYEPKSRDLDIHFRSGPTWRYSSVPEPVFLEFLRSQSKGKYFLKHIRSQYPEKKLS